MKKTEGKFEKGRMRFARTTDNAEKYDIGGRGESNSPYKTETMHRNI